MDKSVIIGREQIVDHLKTAVQVQKISHAYLFHGEKGIGKKYLAKYFAKLLQCEKGGTEPCGICKSCIQTDSDNQPDIKFVTHEKTSIGVDDIRNQVTQDIGIKPYSSRYKIYIIPDADRMTEQAQNALLKTIEEPPSYGILIVLASNIHRMLPTIQSRCIALQIKAVEVDKIKEYLIEHYQVPDYAAQMAADFSNGNIGRAVRYVLSDEFMQMKEEVLHFLRFMDQMQLHEMMEAVKSLSGYKTEIKDCIDLMTIWFRDILLLKVTGDPNRLIYKEEYRYIAEQAAKREYENIENAIEALEKAQIRLDANVNFDTVIELMLLAIRMP